MKKKLLLLSVCFVLFTSFLGVGVIGYAASTNQSSTVSIQSSNSNILEWCKIAADCILGFLCIADRCVPSGDSGAEIGLCQCANSQPCGISCRCGYTSSGTGPVSIINHNCR